MASIDSKENKTFSATYNTSSKVLLLTGARATYHLASDQPVDLASSDDFPVTAVVPNPQLGCVLTTHNRTVKIWDAATGAVVETYSNLADHEITAACLDHTGRKFFVGCRDGSITGHVFLGGTRYRVFQEPATAHAVVELAYFYVRANRRLLFAAGCHESFIAFEDNDTDTKLIAISQPVHIITALLRVNFEGLQRTASTVHTGDVAPQPEIADTPTETPTRSPAALGADGPGRSMLVRSCVLSNADVQSLLNVDVVTGPVEVDDMSHQVTPRAQKHSAKPRGALGDRAGSTVRRMQRLRDDEDAVTANIPKSLNFDFTLMRLQPRLSLIYVAVRNVVAVVDALQLVTVHVFVFEADVTVVAPLGDLPAFAAVDAGNVLYVHSVRPSRSPEQLICLCRLGVQPSGSHRAHVAASGHYHASTQTLVIGDNLGFVTAWNLKAAVRMCKLTPTLFPSNTLSATVLRKKITYPAPSESGATVTLSWGPAEHHTDEVTALLWASNPKGAAVIISAAWGDHRVRFWQPDGTSLGELSQGRLQNPDSADQETVALHYRRHGVKPFAAGRLELDQEFVDVEDMPELVILLLRKAARRYKARKQREAERKSFIIANRGRSFADSQAALAASPAGTGSRRQSMFGDIRSAQSFVMNTSTERKRRGSADGKARESPQKSNSPRKRQAHFKLPDGEADASYEASDKAGRSGAIDAPYVDESPAQQLPDASQSLPSAGSSDDDEDIDAVMARVRHTSMSEWTTAKDLDRPQPAVDAVHVGQSTSQSPMAMSRSQLTSLRAMQRLAAKVKLRNLPTYGIRRAPAGGHPRGVLVGEQLERARRDHEETMRRAAGAVSPPAAGEAPRREARARDDLRLSETTRLIEQERERVQHERYVAARVQLREQSLEKMHRAIDAFRALPTLAADMGREARCAHRESATAALPAIARQVSHPPEPPPRDRHPARTARGPTVARHEPIGHREAERRAADALFAPEPWEAPSRGPAATTRSHSSATTFSTSRYNTGAFTPVYRTDATPHSAR